MTYTLKFLQEALEEWQALDNSVRKKLKSKLMERLKEPCVPSARLRGTTRELYKIKLKNPGYRLVYEVYGKTITVEVITVGRRDKVYKQLEKRINKK
jgi:mRNA interferase RelE/StbE